jgi:hypothetical protein
MSNTTKFLTTSLNVTGSSCAVESSDFSETGAFLNVIWNYYPIGDDLTDITPA